jgi:hypothetical protein
MPDLHDLETLVRAARPAPDPRWTGRMDRRVAERFPAPPRWWHWQRARGPMLLAGSAASVLLVLVLVITGSNGGGGSVSSSSSTASTAAAPTAAERDSAGAATDAPPVSPQSRSVIRSVSLTLATRPGDVENVSDRVIRVADTLGGYVQDSSITAGESAQLTLRVPGDKLQQALTQLSRLAHVRSRTQQAQDVTDQHAALAAGVRDARAYRDGLRTRLARASTQREASSLRGRLQRAERSLTLAERRLAQLSRETSLATIDVQVRGDRSAGAAAPANDRWTPGDALRDAGRVLEVVAGVALIALAVALPLALLAVCAALLARLFTRRRRERALELA